MRREVFTRATCTVQTQQSESNREGYSLQFAFRRLLPLRPPASLIRVDSTIINSFSAASQHHGCPGSRTLHRRRRPPTHTLTKQAGNARQRLRGVIRWQLALLRVHANAEEDDAGAALGSERRQSGKRREERAAAILASNAATRAAVARAAASAFASATYALAAVLRAAYASRAAAAVRAGAAAARTSTKKYIRGSQNFIVSHGSRAAKGGPPRHGRVGTTVIHHTPAALPWITRQLAS